jgi:hypothetical protein
MNPAGDGALAPIDPRSAFGHGAIAARPWRAGRESRKDISSFQVVVS